MRFIPLTLIILLLSLAGVSCISDDITTSPSASLVFSSDTVSFDTVFTGEGTPTARLRVFNRNSKGVNISSIRFRKPGQNFSMNVDGVSGTEFENVEIRGGDSIFVFIECFIDETSGSKPEKVENAIEFVTNGNSQEVTLEAWGQNVTRLRDKVIDTDMRLTAERPIVVYDTLRVAPGATLSIEPGTMLLFHDKAALMVEGTLEALGEPGRMIQMRGDRLDNVLPDVGYDILAGQWEGIRFAAGSFGNRMEYVDMRSTVSGIEIDSCADLSRSKLLLRNSWLHNSQGNVLTSRHSRVDAYGVCFSDAAGAVVSLTGGSHRFVQCTIANYYLFAAVSEPLLSLFHLLPTDAGDDSLPLMSASFENCIIYGLGQDINVGDLTGSDVFLRNVLLKSEGSDDDNFINCLWDEDPLFYTVRQDYIFNYRLRPDSPAIGAGDPFYVGPETLTDMDGLDRLADGNPALGAYVYIPPKEEE